MEVRYPRPDPLLADADRLRDLADGYFRLGPVFLGTLLAGYPLNVVLIIGFNGLPNLLLPTFLLTTAVVAWLTLAPLRKIGRGSGWLPATPMIVALLLGLTAPMCCGAIGFPIVMGAALRRMRRLGVKVGFLGPTREDVYACWRTLTKGS